MHLYHRPGTGNTKTYSKTCIRHDSHKVSGISQSDPESQTSNKLQMWPRRDQQENQTISNGISRKNQRLQDASDVLGHS